MKADQTGLIIARSIYGGPSRQLALLAQKTDLSDAEVSAVQYESEVLLLCYAAALYAIKSVGLPTNVANGVIEGLYRGIGELPCALADFLVKEIDNSVATYVKAWNEDSGLEVSVENLTALEEEFGERLLALGQISEKRIRACIRLCMSTPKVLWSVQLNGAIDELRKSHILMSH